MEALIKRQQQKFDSYVKRSDDRLSAIERQFTLFSKLDEKIDAVTTHATKATTDAKASTESLRKDLHSYNHLFQAKREISDAL